MAIIKRERWFLSPFFLPLNILVFGLLLVFFESVEANATTYYVATTGNDSSSGTSASPWRNPQKCAAYPVKAGDTCLVRRGTYYAPTGKTVVVYVNSSSASGTSSLPITIKSETPLGASLIIPSTSSTLNTAFYLTKPYYIIDGFDISGGANNGASVGFAGIYVTPAATGTIIRSNSIHHIGRSVCSNSSYGFAAIYLSNASSPAVQENRIFSIGRRRNGESGCSTTRYQNDHGIYVSGGSNATIRRNVFYDTNRGYPIHVYGGTATNLNIYHNTMSGRSPTGQPVGQIMLGSTIRTASIKNNISSNAQGGMIHTWSLSGSGISVTYNLSNTMVKSSASVSGASFSSNFEKLSPLFISESSNDFRLSSSSPSINRGTSSGVPIVPDGTPDVGGYEYSLQNTVASPLTPTGIKTY